MDSTYSSAVQFLQDGGPDWGQRVEYESVFRTLISTSRNGTEQRSRQRSVSRVNLRYSTGRRTARQQTLARIRGLAQLGAATVVPVWTHPLALVSLVSNVATLAQDAEPFPFRVGGYAYFEESGLASVFREVEGVSEDEVTLAAGNAAFPDGTPPSYSTACLVYPCVLAVRADNNSRHRLRMVNESFEDYDWEEL